MICWFKRHYQEDWRPGEIIQWMNAAERLENFAYSVPSAVVRECGTGWVYVVDCGLLNMLAMKPTEIQRPEVDETPKAEPVATETPYVPGPSCARPPITIEVGGAA